MNKSIVIVILFVLFGLQATPAFADSSVEHLTAVGDSVVDFNAPDAVNSASSLQFEQTFAYDDMAGMYCPTTTKQFFVKFDLTTVDFTIDKARFTLRATGEVANLPLTLMVAENNWSEDSVTWNNQPMMVNEFMAQVEADNGVFTWTDENLDFDFADYVADMQAAGETEITLAVGMPAFMGCSPDEMDSVTAEFGSREAHAVSFAPSLDVASVDGLLDAADSVPTAVTLSNVNTQATQAGNPMVWITLLFAGMTALTVIASNKVATQTI